MSRRSTALSVSAALFTTATLATLAACGTTHRHVVVTSQPAAYSMNAYGQNGQCYYIDDPAEATALIAAGLCQPSWRPYPMPLSWHEEYLDYYNSPAYYNTYVPVSYRSGWANQWGPNSSWYRQNKTTIIVVQKNAVYKDPSGKPIAATAIPSSKMSFGAGVTAKPSFGSVAPPSADASKPSFGGGVTAKQSFGGAAPSQAKPSFGGGVTQKPAPVVPR